MRQGWFHLATGAGVGRVVGFASNLFLSRWLGPTQLGLFNLVTTTVQTSDTLVRCGGDYALNFELGGHPQLIQTERGVGLARGFVHICTLTTVLICGAILIGICSGQIMIPIPFVSSHRLLLIALLLTIIACEGLSASAWEILLVSHRTAELALRQGLFFPLRLILAAFGALFLGIWGAIWGLSIVALAQCVWLKIVIGNLWTPLKIFPFSLVNVLHLLKRGLPFYFSNILSALVFYPLLVTVANSSGLAEIGYLRVGQVLQQLFAFIPATLAPVLFLRLRSESSFENQVAATEQPFRIIWLVLIQVLIVYCVIDHYFIEWLFGPGFSSALLPTRLLLVTALLECLAQLLVQPLLAAGKIGLYGFWQNIAALLSACLGWIWIPTGGLPVYLIVRLIYVTIPLAAFAIAVVKQMRHPKRLLVLLLTTSGLVGIMVFQVLHEVRTELFPVSLILTSVITIVCYRNDLVDIYRTLKVKT